MSPLECTRSHTTSDETEGKDRITAHLLNHVESYVNKLKRGIYSCFSSLNLLI